MNVHTIPEHLGIKLVNKQDIDLLSGARRYQSADLDNDLHSSRHRYTAGDTQRPLHCSVDIITLRQHAVFVLGNVFVCCCSQLLTYLLTCFL